MLSCHKYGTNTVINGAYAGKPLDGVLRLCVNTVDTIESVKSFKDYDSLQDNGRAYFLHEYAYKGKIQCP